jgi:hypothetical protein
VSGSKNGKQKNYEENLAEEAPRGKNADMKEILRRGNNNNKGIDFPPLSC